MIRMFENGATDIKNRLDVSQIRESLKKEIRGARFGSGCNDG